MTQESSDEGEDRQGRGWPLFEAWPGIALARVCRRATCMIGDGVTDLLGRLSTPPVDSAWREFLDQYSPLLMHAVRAHERQHERATDCFLFVCEALSDDGFGRLLSFRPDGPARFRTWLMAVVSNLCVDWRRQCDGRRRPIRAVARLPELDQLVYRNLFMRGMPRAACLQALKPRFPDLTEQTLSDINARLFALLTPQQRWQLSAQAAHMVSLDDDAGLNEDGPAWQLEEPGPGPDALAATEQDRKSLNDALGRLPAEQRLLLRLRFEQNLTLAEVARLTGQSDPFRANRKIQAALAALGRLMDSRTPESDRKTR